MLAREPRTTSASGLTRASLIAIWLVCALGGLAWVGPASASAANFTWSGAAGSGVWSDAANWRGASAPSGSVGTITFPALGCSPMTECVANINVEGITMSALKIDDASGYAISPVTSGDTNEDLVIGAGGLSASTQASSAPNGTPELGPVDLQGQQTWTIDGGPAGVGALGIGKLTGRSTGGGLIGGGTNPALEVDLSDAGTLTLAGNGVDNEPGSFSVVGANSADTGATALENGTLTFSSPGGELNTSSTVGGTTTLDDVALTGSGSFGSLSATGSLIGFPSAASPGLVQVNGSADIDNGTLLDLPLTTSGTTAGTSFAQLNATNTITLNGASLSVFPSAASSVCPSLKRGDVDRILTAVGGISGTFAGVPNGAQITPSCIGQAPTVQINYTGYTVTATVQASGGPAFATVIQLTSSSTTPPAGANVQLVAAVGPANTATSTLPTGTVSFFDNGAALVGCGNEQLTASGSGSGASADCTVGVGSASHSISAVFTPVSPYWAGSASNTLIVTPVAGVLSTASTQSAKPVSVTNTSASAPAITHTKPTTITLTTGTDAHAPQLLSYRASVTTTTRSPATISGSVTFYETAIPIPGCVAVPLTAGTASCSTGLQMPGTQTISAVYAGSPSLSASIVHARVTSTLSIPTASFTHLNASAPALSLSLRSARAAITGVRLQFVTAGISFTQGAAFMSASGALKLRSSGALVLTARPAGGRAYFRLGSGGLKLAPTFPSRGAVTALAFISFRHGPEAELLVTIPR